MTRRRARKSLQSLHWPQFRVRHPNRETEHQGVGQAPDRLLSCQSPSSRRGRRSVVGENMARPSQNPAHRRLYCRPSILTVDPSGPFCPHLSAARRSTELLLPEWRELVRKTIYKASQDAVANPLDKNLGQDPETRLRHVAHHKGITLSRSVGSNSICRLCLRGTGFLPCGFCGPKPDDNRTGSA